jgi:DNA adenine methylase Dam
MKPLSSSVEPPFNYTGSKFTLLPQILPLFEAAPRFVDVFSGGGSVYANVLNLYDAVVANDIIYLLIDVQQRLAQNPEATIAATKAFCVEKTDQEGYHRLRDDFNANPSPEKLWALMCCCTNNMMRFNRQWKFNQTFGKRTFNPRTLEKALSFAKYLAPHLDRITFLSLDFEKVPVQSGDLIYIDPPYSNTEAGYNAYWHKDDDVRLFNWVQRILDLGCKVAVSGIASHNGEPCRLLQLLETSGFHASLLQHNYNKVSRAGTKESQEVLLTSYKPALAAPVPVSEALTASA